MKGLCKNENAKNNLQLPRDADIHPCRSCGDPCGNDNRRQGNAPALFGVQDVPAEPHALSAAVHLCFGSRRYGALYGELYHNPPCGTHAGGKIRKQTFCAYDTDNSPYHGNYQHNFLPNNGVSRSKRRGVHDDIAKLLRQQQGG